MDSMVADGMTVFPSGVSCGVTSTGSHLIGAYYVSSVFTFVATRGLVLRTPDAAKMSLTDWEISGPIPSPSIKETA